MRFSLSTSRVAAALAIAYCVAYTGAQSRSVPDLVDLAQKQVIAYLADLANVQCKESVVQEKLSENGHVRASERSEFDYFIMMQGNGNDFQLTETREAISKTRDKPLPMLVTNGFSTLLLIFHPYYRDSFQFEVGPEASIQGTPALPVHFMQIAGKRSPAALSLRGREYALGLKGTAWLDQQSGHVLMMDASLLNDMSDIGLRSLTIHVDYKLTARSNNLTSLVLPALAVIDVQTARQHWRNTHVFTNYGTFATSAEQGPAVTLHQANPPTQPTDPVADKAKIPKEKP